MRQILAVGFILIFISAIVLPFGAIELRRSQIKANIKHHLISGVSKSELSRIALHKTDIASIHWKEPKKEFFLNNNMYDVVETVQKKDSIIFWSWLDEKENHLEAQLHELLAMVFGSDKTTQNQKDSLLSFIKHLFFEKPSIDYALQPRFGFQFSDYKRQHDDYLKGISTPPPQTVC